MIWQKRDISSERVMEALKKKVLVVEEDKIGRLKEALGTKSESDPEVAANRI
ncbi:MAG: hypothetical protein HY314_16650 [Acidobacteria bacterium]|nr:hypothetical protein [Acidobacteriota bacterium]